MGIMCVHWWIFEKSLAQRFHEVAPVGGVLGIRLVVGTGAILIGAE